MPDLLVPHPEGPSLVERLSARLAMAGYPRRTEVEIVFVDPVDLHEGDPLVRVTRTDL